MPSARLFRMAAVGAAMKLTAGSRAMSMRHNQRAFRKAINRSLGR
jgi:hypothetical protein